MTLLLTREFEQDPPAARPRAAIRRPSWGKRYLRPLAGLGTVATLLAIFAFSIGLFRGSFTETVPVTVISHRTGLVMNPDAKVKIRGVQVGTVASVEQRPDGTAALHLAMDPSQLRLIPANVRADIASSTVFGAKFVNLEAPADPSPAPMFAGQVLDGQHVTVEMNTVFEQLTSVLKKVDPAKLNESLGAVSTAFSGRGEKIGEALSDFNGLLTQLEPSLPAMSRDIEATAAVSGAYADAAPDLLRTVDNATQMSRTLVDEQHNLQSFLMSMIGLADTGQDVVGANRPALSETLQLFEPTSSLLNEYAPNLHCTLTGMEYMMHQPPLMDPGVLVNVAFTLGIERYRYPQNLPKVAAKGGPNCMGLPYIGFGNRAKYLVTDTNANPWQYGNRGIVLNSDGLKQLLFGPLQGPPRNTAQIGEPG